MYYAFLAYTIYFISRKKYTIRRSGDVIAKIG